MWEEGGEETESSITRCGAARLAGTHMKGVRDAAGNANGAAYPASVFTLGII